MSEPTPRSWNDGWRCGECCNKDGCDDPTHHERPICPFCRGTGSAIWNMYKKESAYKELERTLAAQRTTLLKLADSIQEQGVANKIREIVK